MVTGLTDWTAGIRFLAGAEKGFFLRHSVQSGCGAHKASFPVGTGDYFPRAWSRTFTSI